MLIQIRGENTTAIIDTERVRYIRYDDDGYFEFSFGSGVTDNYFVHGVSKNEMERFCSELKAAECPNA